MTQTETNPHRPTTSTPEQFIAGVTDFGPLFGNSEYLRVRNETKAAEYFGLNVEVTCLMQHCALVRFEDREFVVDAADLVFVRTLRQVA